jgi:hypothetical protein
VKRGRAAVILTNSCARGKASRDSCLDMVVLVPSATLAAEGERLVREWEDFHATGPVFRRLEAAGKYAQVHLDLIDGQFEPSPHEWTSGPDSFEVEIGNYLVYGVPLWQRGDYLDRLKARWLPYYGEDLRRERLATGRHYCLNNLHHIPVYVPRGLYFQSFDRLYNAYREFLQVLFIARRTYPIAYDKWIREQVVEILGLPELYPRLVRLLEIRHLESMELVEKARLLEQLLDEYGADGG